MRILALDFGLKRTGIATTDPLRIIVSGLDTVETPKLIDFLTQYCRKEQVSGIVIGQPIMADGEPTYLEAHIQEFITVFSALFPDIEIYRQDEYRTSKKASAIIFASGIGKKKRRDKALTDKVSAVIILEEYLGWM